MKLKYSWLLLLAASSVAVVACGESGGEAAASSPPVASGGRGARDPNRVVPVEVSVAARGTITHTTSLSGVVEPIRRVGVNSQLSGAVLNINVEEGDRVARDSVLARLDSRELEAQLASAEASFLAATSAMTRAEKMRAAQIYTDIEYERDRTALAAAKAQRDQIITRLGYATVRAPIAGVIVEKRVESGDIVGSQTRMFSIADVSTLVVKVNVSELDVTGLVAGQSVDVSIDALSDKPIGGRIRRVFPVADSISRLVPVEVELTGSNVPFVKPGFLARTTFTTDARVNALLIPAAALMVNSAATVVYVVREGLAEMQNVRTGLNYAAQVEILDGLNEGDSVIVTGNSGLRRGAKVRVVQSVLSDTVTSAGVGRSGGGSGPSGDAGGNGGGNE